MWAAPWAYLAIEDSVRHVDPREPLRDTTLTFPLLGVRHVHRLARLRTGKPRVRVGIHAWRSSWRLLIGATVADSQRFSRRYGRPVLAAEQRVEQEA